MTVLLAIGIGGLLFLLLAVVLGDVLDGLLPGDPGAGISAACGAALAAFGLGGALALSAGSLPLAGALTAGGVGAVVTGIGSYVAARALIGHEQPPERASDLYGTFGTVVSAIPTGGLGLVALPHRGTRKQLSARSNTPLATGTKVHVVEILSDTAVVVAPLHPVLPSPQEGTP